MELPRFTSTPRCFWMSRPAAVDLTELQANVCRVGVKSEQLLVQIIAACSPSCSCPTMTHVAPRSRGSAPIRGLVKSGHPGDQMAQASPRMIS